MASGDNQALSPTKQALLALRELQSKLRALEDARNEPVAIIGMGCRYPGMEGVEAFWRGLCQGANTIGEVPSDRWDVDALCDPGGAPGTMISRRGGFLRHLDEFDAGFFGISPREAPHVDPRQRLILEVAWEALEAAGIPPDGLAGSRTGVFVSTLTNDYDHLLFSDLRRADAYSGAGTANSIVANRLSYFLDLHGPSIALDTACSGSLVAVHLACESLRRGESALALAGGVNVNLMAKSNVFFSRAGALSPDGNCKSFDRDANGMVRSDGAGIVILKLLSQAQSDGDPIVAVIRGSAMNHDGRSNGIMAPNGEAQRRVLAEAYRNAGIAPGDVQLIEAHGTGTRLGDPIEVQALGDVLTEGRSAGKRCALGSVKTNIGHSEAAAGIAGIIKAALCLQHREVPPSLHFHEPNPLIPFDRLPLFVPQERMPWPSPDETLIAGVSGFGFGGTNAHVVLQEAPAMPETSEAATPAEHLLPLSAKTPKALQGLAEAWRDALKNESSRLGDLVYTAAVRRSHFPCRIALTAATTGELRTRLEHRLAAKVSEVSNIEDASAPGRTVFVFSGQGSHWPRMGLRLFEEEPVFRNALKECDRLLGACVSWSLLDELRRDGKDSRIDETEIAQTAIFSIQVSLAALWRSWGIVPDAVVGHSLGEVAATHVAGVLSLGDAIQIVVHRSRLMSRAAGNGRTAVVGLPLDQINQRLHAFDGRLAVAGCNSPSSSVVSGDTDAVEAFVQQAEKDGIFSRIVAGVEIAFHSPHMDPLRSELVSALQWLCPQPATIPIFSTVTTEAQEGIAFDAEYWGRNLRDPFLFAQTMERLLKLDYSTFLEVSPHAVLASAMVQTARQCGAANAAILTSLRRAEDGRSALLPGLGHLYELGHPVDWTALYGRRGRCMTLPSYPWQRQRYWYDQLDGRAGGAVDRRPRSGHPFLGQRFEPALPLYADSQAASAHGWELEIDSAHPGYLNDHRILGEAVLPGAACLEMALQAGRQVLTDGVMTVSGLTFENALKLPESVARRMQVLITGDDKARSFLLFSRGAAAQSAWVRHASGTIRSESVEYSSPVDLNAVRARCREEVSPETHYSRMHAGGLEYGPTFRVIRQIWQGDGEALARIQLVSGTEDSRYAMHPILLDAALQTAAAAIPEARSEQPERYLPHAVRCWRLLQSPGDRIWCYAVMRNAPGAELLEADLTITNETGAVLATLDGLVLKRVRSERKTSIREGLLQEEWQECPLPVTRCAPRKWLMLADESGIGPAAAERLREQGHPVVVARKGSQFQRVDDSTFIVRAGQPDDFHALIHAMGKTIDGVVHLWALDGPELDADSGALMAAQRSGCGSALLLTQAMLDASCSARLWLVTRGAQAVRREPLRVEQAPQWGLGLIIGQEHPELHCSCVDLDVSDVAAASATLVSELLHADREQRVAWRQGTRFAARLMRAAWPTGDPKLHVDATYLITGGLGALGLRTSEMLVERGARHLVLTGRRGAEGKESRLQPLRDAGADVRVICADLASPEDVGRLLQQIRDDMPPLRGVIHSAGVLDDGLVRQQTFERFESVMAPKVRGAWNLHRQTLDQPLDFFILYSSAASMVGSAGQSNYAAANAFLDALAHHRRAIGLPAVSINWGAWREDGMAAREQTLARMAARGVGSIEPSEGLDLLAALLRPDVSAARVGVFPVDWARFLRQFTGDVPSLFAALHDTPASASNAFRQQWESVPPSARESLLRKYLRDTLASVMGFGASNAIQARQGFFDLGMDSLTALEFRNRLESGLGIGLPSTLVFDYPNLEALEKCVDEVLSAEASAFRATPPAPSSESSSAEELDALSDDELARLLELELEEGGR